MSMEIRGNDQQPQMHYAEQVKEEQASLRAGKEKGAVREAEPKGAEPIPWPRDEYISSEKAGTKPTGLYRVERDEKGERRIFFDDPKKADGRREADGLKESGTADGKAGLADGGVSREKAGGRQPKADVANPEAPEEKCVGNTDKVEREIRELKEKKRQLEQQLRSASGDEKRVRELEKKLAQVENELSQKDTDTYRRQNTVFTSGL